MWWCVGGAESPSTRRDLWQNWFSRGRRSFVELDRTTNFDHIFTLSFQIGGPPLSLRNLSGLGASEPRGQSTAPSALFHRRRQLLHPLSFPLHRIRCTCCGSTARAPIVAVVAPTPEGQRRPTPRHAHTTPLPLHHMVLPPCARSWAPRPPPSSFSSSFHRRPPARCLHCAHFILRRATPRCTSCSSYVQRLPLLLHLPAARAIHRRRLRVHVLRHVDELLCKSTSSHGCVSRDPRTPQSSNPRQRTIRLALHALCPFQPRTPSPLPSLSTAYAARARARTARANDLWLRT